jgi:hypothetical protein
VVLNGYLNDVPHLSSSLPPQAPLRRVAPPWSTRLGDSSSLCRPKLGSPSDLASLVPSAPPYHAAGSPESSQRRCQPCPSTLPYFFGSSVWKPGREPSPDLRRPQVARELQWGCYFLKSFLFKSDSYEIHSNLEFDQNPSVRHFKSIPAG